MQNSAKFPNMSWSLQAFGFFEAAGCDWNLLLVENQAYSPSCDESFPKLYVSLDPALHAYSHSASVRSRYFLPIKAESQRQYWVAAYHVMLIAGRLPLPHPRSGFP